MFKFIQVNQEKKESKLNETTQEKTIKTFYENHYYKIIKEERDVIYSDHNVTRKYVGYDVVMKSNETIMPEICIKNDYEKSLKDDFKYKVEVSTTSFAGRDLNFIEKYAHKLMYAVGCAREIERMLNNKEL